MATTEASVTLELRTFHPGIWFIGALAWLFGKAAMPLVRHVPIARIRTAGRTQWLTIANATKEEPC